MSSRRSSAATRVTALAALAVIGCGSGGGSRADADTTVSMGMTDGEPPFTTSGSTSSVSTTSPADTGVTEGSPVTETTTPTTTDGGATATGDTGMPPGSGAVRFTVNAAGDHDYGRQVALPAAFGVEEFTLEVWITPDASFPVGPTTGGSAEQLQNWSDADEPPYGASDWWYSGNFLLDGHNNASFSAGTFSLQFYGGGRVRWLFGDGASDLPGNVWSVGAYPAETTASLLDDQAHLLTCVRRANGGGATLELWIDGALVDDESTPVLTDMQAAYWADWSGFLDGQAGWFWGAEKQAAIGELSQYEDYKGAVAELRFWAIARGDGEIAASPGEVLAGDEPGLVGLVRFDEGEGLQACDALAPGRCMDLYRMQRPVWIE
jgi:hypothetical protein